MNEIEKMINYVIKSNNEDSFVAYIIKKGLESGIININNQDEVFDDFENLRMVSINMYGIERDDYQSKSYVMMSSSLHKFLNMAPKTISMNLMSIILEEGSDYLENGDFFRCEDLGKDATEEKLDGAFFDRVFPNGL